MNKPAAPPVVPAAPVVSAQAGTRLAPPPADTPWSAGRLDFGHGPQRVLFGRVYEDVIIEQAAFAGAERVVCIASAGCTAMALAGAHQVTALDINPVQLAYAQARARGAPMQVGAAERIVAIGRSLMRPFGWSRAHLEAFLALDAPAAQLQYWNAHLNTTGFRLATDGLLSFFGLRAVYAPGLLKVLPPHFGRVMRARLERCWRRHPNRSNPYAHDLLLGDARAVPHSAAHEAIEFVHQDAASYYESCAAGSIGGIALSNILDGAPPAYRARLVAAVKRAAAPRAQVVLRSFADPPPGLADNRAADDRSILWGVVQVVQADELA